MLEGADAAKRRAVLRNMSIELIPVMEKGIVDPVLSHRCVLPWAPNSAPPCPDTGSLL